MPVQALFSMPRPFLGHGLFTFFLLNSKGPHKSFNQGRSGQWQLIEANPLNLCPRLPFPLTFQCANSRPVLVHLFPIIFLGSLIFSYPNPFLYFTVPNFNKLTLKITWTSVVKLFLHKVKNPHTTGLPEADLLQAWFPSSDIINQFHIFARYKLPIITTYIVILRQF